MKVGDMVRAIKQEEFSKYGYGFILDEDCNYNRLWAKGGPDDYRLLQVLWYSSSGKKKLWYPDWELWKV